MNAGDKLWAVGCNRFFGLPRCREVVIERVGYKWLYLAHGYKVLIRSMDIYAVKDEVHRVGRCYPSQDVYESNEKAQELYIQLKAAIANWRVVGETVRAEDVLFAAELLGIELKE